MVDGCAIRLVEITARRDDRDQPQLLPSLLGNRATDGEAGVAVIERPAARRRGIVQKEVLFLFMWCTSWQKVYLDSFS